MSNQVARRAQAIAVERCADHSTVGEGDGGRTVPGLHQRSVIFVEGLLVLGHGRVVIPGFRNQHRHDVRQLRP